MNVTVHTLSSEGVVKSIAQSLQVRSDGSCGLSRFKLPGHLGAGRLYVQRWAGDSFHLYLDGSLREDFVLEMPPTQHPLAQSAAVVCGTLHLTVGDRAFEDVLREHTSCVFRPGPGHHFTLHVCAGEEVKVSYIHFGQHLVDDLVSYMCDTSLSFLLEDPPADGSSQITCGQVTNFNVSELLLHTFDHDSSGLTFNAHTHSKTLLVVSEQLKLAESLGHEHTRPPGVTAEDMRLLLAARDRIDRDYASDLTIVKLARSVGINQQKLKTGFKTFFNITVSRYLRSVRLAAARDLLDTGRWTIKEAANAVGYTNQSHFAARFREEYGVSPSEYLRQPRTQKSPGHLTHHEV